ncbi:protein NRT1/ PTR FAMILY 5.6 [Elaeis guineensis]|uniref:Protein NRT1/ PTR FAMILY 5.6 n=1 Tax=Elaeis guineensis var. tenera TaxID=51953 RepID=A0A6J0PIP3_ELAGV|nr:protein NRT1/ PTR FAMILY 5.6 [Elaeis guineensis]
MEPGWLDNKARVLESEVDDKRRVNDLSVDHKGRAPLKASTGVWKASLFIIAIEFSERLSYFGLSTNLIIYLTKVLHQELKTAAKNVNYWSGVTTMMPLVGGFVADAYLGRFSTVIFSSLIYLAGLILLTMSQLVPSLKPCNLETCHRSLRLHEIIFLVAMYSISVGTGGHKSSLESFGADQFDDDDAEERKKKMSYFNWWNFLLCSGLLLGVTVIVYIQDKVSWGAADIVLTSAMGVSLVIFYLGKPFYRYQLPNGSLVTPILQVLVAAMAKRHLPHPLDAGQLHEVPKTRKNNKRLLSHTNQLRFLDKAAIIEHTEDESALAAEKLNQWRLATVTQVEEAKLVLAMVPIWLFSLPFGICLAQASTFFVKQGSIMDRKLSRSFEIPAASIYSLSAMGMIISVCFYDKILVPFLRRATGDERGISILRRIGIGMVFSVLAMIVAAIVESKRLKAAPGEQAEMSVFWLAPQFIILGVGDGFTLVGLQEYFYDQVPDNMRSLGIAFYLSVIGVSNFLSSLLITVVDHVTEKGGRAGWFARDLNKSRLDLFYWLLAVMDALSLCVYVYVASRYSYKTVSTHFPEEGDIETG